MKKIVPAPYIDQTERWVNGCESIHDIIKSLDNGNVQCSSTEIHNERKHILFRLLDVLG